MAKKTEEGFNFSENYLSLGLGILVVVVIGALIFNYISNRQGKKGETSSSTEEQKAQEEQNKAVSLPATYKVTSGDDLWKISEKYYKSGYNWVDIARANNLENPNVLFADTELTIPEVEPKVLTVAEATTQPTVKTSNEASNTPGAITGDSYTIVKGDDLWNIAVRAYGDGYKWVEIAKANGLVNPDIIHAENVLKLPR